MKASTQNTKGKRKKAAGLILTVLGIAFLGRILWVWAAVPARSYREAETLQAQGAYEEAMRAYDALGSYRDAAQKSAAIKEDRYLEVGALMKRGDNEKAVLILEGLKAYKDSAELLLTLLAGHPELAQPGLELCFGHYEQDNRKENGAEAVEWIVLAREEGKLLLISKYALDSQRFNQTQEPLVTWRESSLRAWLNDGFLNSCFSNEEQQKILTTEVMTEGYPGLEAYRTQEKVFLLSVNEAEQYFAADMTDDSRQSEHPDLICGCTDYAKRQGIYTGDRETADGLSVCWWWLRSGSYLKNDTVAFVGPSGIIDTLGTANTDKGYGVRPVIRIDLAL